MQVSTIWCHLDPQHALERPRLAIRVPGEFHEASSRMLLADWSSPQRLPVALPHSACPLRWDDALARWTPLASADNGEMPFLYNAFSPENYNFHHNLTFPDQNAKRHPPKKMSFLCGR